jgi:hypothetical protein
MLHCARFMGIPTNVRQGQKCFTYYCKLSIMEKIQQLSITNDTTFFAKDLNLPEEFILYSVMLFAIPANIRQGQKCFYKLFKSVKFNDTTWQPIMADQMIPQFL